MILTHINLHTHVPSPSQLPSLPYSSFVCKTVSERFEHKVKVEMANARNIGFIFLLAFQKKFNLDSRRLTLNTLYILEYKKIFDRLNKKIFSFIVF